MVSDTAGTPPAVAAYLRTADGRQLPVLKVEACSEVEWDRSLAAHRPDEKWTGIGRELAIYATSLFRSALRNGELPYTGDELVRALAGRDLACWCPVGQAKMPFWSDTQPCHADVLLAAANGWGW